MTKPAIIGKLIDPEWAAQEINRLNAEIERLRERAEAAIENEAIATRDQAAEIERLLELVRGIGANRYWEGRWRDEKVENEKLRALLREAVPFINDAGNDEDPEAQQRANDLFVRVAAALEQSQGPKEGK